MYHSWEQQMSLIQNTSLCQIGLLTSTCMYDVTKCFVWSHIMMAVAADQDLNYSNYLVSVEFRVCAMKIVNYNIII